MKTLTSLAAAAALVIALPLCAQSGAPAGKVERIKVHSPAIEGNLQGNTADRDVLVYLPPSYASSRNRRYPVVDEEAGVVMGTAIFNRPPGGAKRADGTLWPRLLLTEFFPVEQGRFTAVYAAMFYLPADAVDSGWKE